MASKMVTAFAKVLNVQKNGPPNLDGPLSNCTLASGERLRNRAFDHLLLLVVIVKR